MKRIFWALFLILGHAFSVSAMERQISWQQVMAGQISQEFEETRLFSAKREAEQVIAGCEANYQKIKIHRDELVNLKHPGFFVFGKVRKFYRQKDRILKAFDKRMGDFIVFINDKIDIRLAKNPRQIKEKTMAYRGTCQTFSNGLLSFIHYVKTGQARDSVAERVFEEWMSSIR